jgi:putative transposase
MLPRKARLKSTTGVYHIMWRGANRQEIFHDEEDFRQFLKILHKYKLQTNMKVYGWCLMTNHAHLLLKEGGEEISTTMKRVGVCFVQYYNAKYHTTGHLFQGRFRSENIESRSSLLTVIRYIHQNPLKANMVKKIDGWKWSSCGEYYGRMGVQNGLLDSGLILGMYGDDVQLCRESFKAFNEYPNEDRCLEDEYTWKLTDEEARRMIKKVLDGIGIAEVKGLPGPKRDVVLQRIKEIKGLSQRQASRILGVSRLLISKA